MRKKDPPLNIVSISLHSTAFLRLQSVIERDRDGFPGKIYELLKPRLPRLQQVICWLSQGDGWEISYPLPKGYGNGVSPGCPCYCLELGLPGASTERISETIEAMRKEGAPLGIRVLLMAGISDASTYFGTDLSTRLEIESVSFTPVL